MGTCLRILVSFVAAPRKFEIIFLGVALCLNSFAQSPAYFNKQYNLNSLYDEAYSIEQCDSGFFLCGMGGSSYSQIDINFISIDSIGNFKWIKTYGNPNCQYYTCAGSLIKTNDGGFALSGTFVDSVSTKALLVKFNSVGDTLWSKTYGNDSICTAYQCSQTSDHGYILTGWTDLNEYYGDVLLIKTDSLGNEMWRNSFGSASAETGLSVIETIDGGYIVGGQRQTNATGVDPYVIKTDNVGVPQWQRILGGNFDDGSAVVRQLSDGNYIMGSGLTFIQAGGPGVGNPFGKPYLVKLDSNGGTIWSKTYGTVLFNTSITSLLELSDGRILATGFCAGQNNIDGLVIKVDVQGDSLWYRTYGYFWNNDDYLFDIKPTLDNGFIACGVTQQSQMNMWVLKLDSVGCDTNGCNILGISSLSDFEEAIKIYPNPSNGEFIVQGNFDSETKLQIFNTLGEMVLEKEIPVGIQSFLVDAKLNNATYYYRVLNSKAILKSGKLIILK